MALASKAVRVEAYAIQNRTCGQLCLAAIILRDALRCGGDQCPIVTWAHSVLKGEAEQKAWRVFA